MGVYGLGASGSSNFAGVKGFVWMPDGKGGKAKGKGTWVPDGKGGWQLDPKGKGKGTWVPDGKGGWVVESKGKGKSSKPKKGLLSLDVNIALTLSYMF